MLRVRAVYTPHLGLYCIYYVVLHLLCSAYLGLYCIYVVLRFEPRARGLGRCSATAPPPSSSCKSSLNALITPLFLAFLFRSHVSSG